MSDITLVGRATPPDPPGVNKLKIYYDTTIGGLVSEDENGLLTVLASFRRVSRIIYLSAGTTTFTPTVGAKALFVECVGPGGNGGNAISAVTNAAAGGGGGGGAYSASWLTTNVDAACTVQIGTPGNDTYFKDTTNATVCLAKAGSNGGADTVTTAHIGALGGSGGVASTGTGDVKVDGAPGYTGLTLAAAQALSGQGGNGYFGGGGGLAIKNTTGAGNPGKNWGGGGSGACIISGGANQTGGAGANGVIKITEYA